MKAEIKLDCCSYELKTSSNNFNFIDCYSLKPEEKPFKKYLKNRKLIKKELLFVGICPRCGHWILKFLWYDSKTAKDIEWQESKIIRGKKADEIFQRRMDNYFLSKIPNAFKPTIIKTSDVPYSWTYGINKEIKKNGEVVSIRQYRSDFNGQKELVKETLQDGTEKTICHIYENLKGD